MNRSWKPHNAKAMPLLLMALLLISGCREVILHDLDEQQANQVIVLLGKRGIESTKARDGASWNVEVRRVAAAEALQAVEEGRIIRRDLKSLGEQSRSLVPQREEREYFRERKLAWSLEQTLERLPGILEARVHLHLAPLDTLEIRKGAIKESASVLLVTCEGAKVNEELVREIILGAAGVARTGTAVIVVRGAAAQTSSPPVPQKKQTDRSPLVVGALAAAGAGAVMLQLRPRRPPAEPVPLKEEDHLQAGVF